MYEAFAQLIQKPIKNAYIDVTAEELTPLAVANTSELTLYTPTNGTYSNNTFQNLISATFSTYEDVTTTTSTTTTESTTTPTTTESTATTESTTTPTTTESTTTTDAEYITSLATTTDATTTPETFEPSMDSITTEPTTELTTTSTTTDFEYITSLATTTDVTTTPDTSESSMDSSTTEPTTESITTSTTTPTTPSPSSKDITFSKTAVSGADELIGATLKVVNKADNTVVHQWISTEVAKVISLEAGEYEMIEITAPAGYEIAESIQFRLQMTLRLRFSKAQHMSASKIAPSTWKMH